ncbi:hypothetical protein [Erythrobacter sp. THAF29]|uniref:hypothetical protein n=1 Tax=Erythrobacter sp. THAF29 TaxID=2587851 RepID=UPI0012695A38|nr:hypothetical protein [Erythrobacter sp. THAF29]QFT76738.1 hypothetical protein FIU90_04185 [Erythrobacter sp. THAF29]
MMTPLIGAALLAVSAQAATPALTQESKALLRCSAAFALVSHGQSVGNEASLKWPKLDTRGREFFVRALAQLMDETKLGREGISQLASAEARRLLDKGEVEKVMPGCLLMLEGSGV